MFLTIPPVAVAKIFSTMTMPAMRHTFGLSRQLHQQARRRLECLSPSSLCSPSWTAAHKGLAPASTVAQSYTAPLSSSFTAAKRFSTSAIQSNTPAKLIKDPDHPSGVYYHQLHDTSRYAISFLQQPPSSTRSASIIAYVNYPSGSSSQTPIYQYIQQSPDSVETNPAFVELLHQTMKEECVPQDGLIEYEAALRVDGWAHLNDQRHPLMPGRIATPENIIASVAFTDGTLKPDSYEANNVYRIVTGEEGFMDLRPTWLMFIKKRCEEVN